MAPATGFDAALMGYILTLQATLTEIVGEILAIGIFDLERCRLNHLNENLN